MVRRWEGGSPRPTEEFSESRGWQRRSRTTSGNSTSIEDNKTVNAWCMPGGKVAVYTGILPVTQDRDRAGRVMGHEHSHAIAKHGNERMSRAPGSTRRDGTGPALGSNPSATSEIFMAAYGAGAQRNICCLQRVPRVRSRPIGLVLMAKRVTTRVRPSLLGTNEPRKEGPCTGVPLHHPAPESRVENLKNYLPGGSSILQKEPLNLDEDRVPTWD